MDEGTILQRRRRAVRINKAETLLMLRAYRANPTRWADVLADMKANVQHLPQQTTDLYSNATDKQLKDRLSVKLGKLMATRNIDDEDIRQAVENIRANERRLVQPGPARQADPVQQPELQPDDVQQDEPRQDGEPGPARPRDRRDAAAAALSDNDSGDEAREPPRRRRRLAELIRENHELYNKFMKRKLPKLLRDYGIASSESE